MYDWDSVRVSSLQRALKDQTRKLNFTEDLTKATGATVSFVLEDAKEDILTFSNTTVKTL